MSERRAEPCGRRDSQPIELPVPITEAEREQLAHANEERHDWLARDGAPDRTIMRGGYQPSLRLRGQRHRP